MRFTVVLIALLLTVPAYAGINDDNSIHQDQNQVSANDNDNRNHQGQHQDQTATGGNAAQSQSTKATQGNSQNITSGGDTTKITSAVWPATPSTSSKEEKSIYSLFGGFGSNKTEEFIRIQQQMQVLEKLKNDKIVTEDYYQVEVMRLYKQLVKANNPQKLLGFIPVAQRGCNVLNVCGLLAW